jgi:[NiFe] hydrogenase assembly HybE family chaperone
VSVRPACVDRLERAFEEIARTRMAGLPMQHPRLHVEALGFEPHSGPDGEPGWLGTLIAPWCMNLVWLPARGAAIRVGVAREHRLAGERYAFIGAHETLHDLGLFEACSLFSPMGEFDDHEAVLAVAREVLRALRAPPPARPAVPVKPQRRAFLFGSR